VVTRYGVMHKFCAVCGCRLSVDNCSNFVNVCADCLHALEF
jgi:hypothetical protein